MGVYMSNRDLDPKANKAAHTAPPPFAAGHLPADYPITWRNDSGLYDGQDQNRNLTGGFYDGGGSIKYTFPMAYSITMLSWSVIEYQQAFIDTNTIDQAISLIQWGVDYLLKAKYQNIIFAQVRRGGERRVRVD